MKSLKRLPHRRGAILLYTMYLVIMSFVIISVAVDYGHIQIIKTEEQRCADATARGVLEACLWKHSQNGYATPTSMAQNQAQALSTKISGRNPIDPNSGITVTTTTQVGSWYGSAFHNADYTGPLAVQVTVSRTVATGNPVSLTFPLPSSTGLLSKKIDVWAKSTAMLPNPIILLSGGSVSPNGDPWLAGMVSGNASYDDTAPAQSPSALTVIPGSTLTFTNVTGKVRHRPDANVATNGTGPTGGAAYWHMKDPPTGIQPEGGGQENGIADLSAPIESLIGVFLNGYAPNSANNSSIANPAMRDATTDMSQNGISDIQLQQPFYIGDGNTSGGSTQTFTVPGDATRFYLAMMDGFEWLNNCGSFTVGTLSEQPPIRIVQ